MGTLRHKAVPRGPPALEVSLLAFLTTHRPGVTQLGSRGRGERWLALSFLQCPLGSFLGCRGQGFQSSGQVPGKQGGSWYLCVLMTAPGTHVPAHLCTRVCAQRGCRIACSVCRHSAARPGGWSHDPGECIFCGLSTADSTCPPTWPRVRA